MLAAGMSDTTELTQTAVKAAVEAMLAVLQARLPASGGLTDAQLRAAVVPVSGNFYQASQPVTLTSTTITGTVNVAGALTDAQLRASAVAMSAASLPLPSGAATEATLVQVRDAVKAQIDIASTVWTDNSGAYYVRRDLVNEGTGAITVSFTDATGTAATPGAGLKPLGSADRDVTQEIFDATAGGTGYSTGDILGRVMIIDANPSTPVITALWLNLSTGASIAAPTGGTFERSNETIGVRQVGTWNIGSITSLPALPAGGNVIGSIGNTFFGISGTLPAFAATPTFNVGTMPSLPAGANVIGSISNTSFGISGTLPAFAATPTFNLGTVGADPFGANADAASATGSISAKLRLIAANTPSPGTAAPSASSPVTLPNDVVVGAAASIAAVNTDLLTGAVSGWFDAANFHSVAVQIIGSAGISAGAIFFEQTNDTSAAAAGNVWAVEEPTSLTPTPSIAAVTIAASTTRMFAGAVIARYVRVRVSTAFAGGNVQAVAVFSQLPYQRTVQTVHQATAGNLNLTATLASTTITSISAGTNALGAVRLMLPELTADVASAAITTTATTAAVTPTAGHSYEVNVPVTVVTGTTPTLDLSIEESDDNGTNWFKVYDFPRITATGMYRSPKLPLTGNRVRYVQTVAGTTPSFTRAVNRLMSSDPAQALRQLVDRTVVLTTLNNTTLNLDVRHCRNLQLVINLGAASTPPQIQLEGSDDNGASWYSIGSPLSGVASSTVQLTVLNVQTALVRGRVSTAGVTVTPGYVLIKGF